MLRLLRVQGNSLQPTYQEGDFVLVAKIPFLMGKLRRGDVVVFDHPVYGTMIKQVDHIPPEKDEIFVIGTHEFSVDSRDFGPINTNAVIGKVIWHIRTPER